MPRQKARASSTSVVVSETWTGASAPGEPGRVVRGTPTIASTLDPAAAYTATEAIGQVNSATAPPGTSISPSGVTGSSQTVYRPSGRLSSTTLKQTPPHT